MLILEKELLTADPVAAIEAIKEKMYDHERFNMDEYLEYLAHSVWRFHQVGLDIQGESIEEKCQSAISQLMNCGLITIH